MKSRTVRVLMVAAAVVALVVPGYFAWKLDQQILTDRAAIVAFDAQVRQATQSLAALDTAQRGYVAEGQSTDKWQAQVTTMVKGASPKLTELRLAAKTPEAQGALETVVETMTVFGQADAKAREYIGSGQRLSASDVIFADGHDLLNKAMAAVEDARARETAQREAAIAKAREAQLFYVAGAVGLTLVILTVLVPLPRGTTASDGADEASSESGTTGLGLSQAAGKTASGGATATNAVGADDLLATRWMAGAQGLGTAAEICSALARVRNPKDLPALLERAAGVLNATGVIVWMAEGSPAVLRPLLAHGYAPSALARMGVIAPDADNATATAYRTQALQTMLVDPPSGGALVVPLITADGCTGAMAVELRQDVEPSDYLRSVATILAAQLATLITPAPVADVPRAKA